MSTEVKLDNKGWYYDAQLNNEMQSISLHANQKLKVRYEIDKKTGKTIKITGGTALGSYKKSETDETVVASDDDGAVRNDAYNDWEDFGDNESDSDVYTDNYGNPGHGYCLTPICKSIFYEDFNISAANIWSDFGNNAVGLLWDSSRRSAPFMGFLSGAFSDMQEATKASKDNNEKTSKFKGWLAEALGKLSSSTKRMEYYQNRSLVVTGTQMSLYSGTGFDYSNMGMRFTIFPEISATGIRTVPEQLEDMYPYFVGKYKKDTSVQAVINKIAEKVGHLAEDKVQDISEFIGWQHPPGGYEANLRSIDCIHKGTLKLRIGSQYAIPNLVVQSAAFVFSKQMVKFPDSSGKLITSPLFCEVNLVLHPMSKYSSQSLQRIIDSGKTVERKWDLEKKINDNLDSISKNSKSTTGTTTLVSRTTEAAATLADLRDYEENLHEDKLDSTYDLSKYQDTYQKDWLSKAESAYYSKLSLDEFNTELAKGELAAVSEKLRTEVELFKAKEKINNTNRPLG